MCVQWTKGLSVIFLLFINREFSLTTYVTKQCLNESFTEYVYILNTMDSSVIKSEINLKLCLWQTTYYCCLEHTHDSVSVSARCILVSCFHQAKTYRSLQLFFSVPAWIFLCMRRPVYERWNVVKYMWIQTSVKSYLIQPAMLWDID